MFLRMGRLTALALAVLLAALSLDGSFVDDDGNVHGGAIVGIAAVGITRGGSPPSNDRERPNSTVNREQMAAFLARALYPPAADRDSFADDEGNIFENDINRLAAAAITRVCNPPASDRFCPDRSVASFLARALDLDQTAPPSRD